MGWVGLGPAAKNGVFIYMNLLLCKSRFDRLWQNQDFVYDFRAKIHETGSTKQGFEY